MNKQNMILLEKNVQFSLKSMVDDFGRVFFKDDKIYRAINNSKKDYCLKLLESKLFSTLSEKKLIPKTTVADFSLETYTLVLEHEKLLETLQHEWSFSMLKDAALLILEINRICNEHGYELKDAHTLNVLFRGSHPVFVDIGSIAPIDNSAKKWDAYYEFLSSFMVPLSFWSQGKIYITRKLVESNFHRMFTIPNQSIEESGLLDLLPYKQEPYEFKLRKFRLYKNEKYSKSLSAITRKTQGIIKKLSRRNTVIFSYANGVKNTPTLIDIFPQENIVEKIKSLTAPEAVSMWQGYHQKFYEKDGIIEYSARFKRILEIIRSIENVSSIIDLAGNEGYFTQLLNSELPGEQIILADYDANAIDSAYLNLKRSGVQNINSVFLNFMFTPDLRGTTKRLRADLAIALAVTHHLILTANFSLAAIFERLQLYSRDYVIVEFMPLGLWGIGQTNYPVLPEWYTVDWFRNEFGKYFTLILEEQLEENRILFFGKNNPQ